jgi:FMN reductase
VSGAVSLVGICGNFHRPSKPRALVEAVVAGIGARYRVAGEVFDLVDVMPELGSGWDRRKMGGRVEEVLGRIEAAGVLVVGTPVFKGAYLGMFKHLIDLLPQDALAGVPVVLTATGGSDHHSLVIEHELRPLFGFFAAQGIGTGIYANDRDFTDGVPTSEAVCKKIDAAVADLAPWLGRRD